MEYELLLRKKNIKVTKGRITILKVIANSSEAVSASTIYQQCKNTENYINLSTVYRSLELFEQNGIIEKFDLGNGEYEYKLKEYTHKHILECSLCKKKVEIDCPMPQIEELIKNKTGFVLLEHELKLKAICEECRKTVENKTKQNKIK